MKEDFRTKYERLNQQTKVDFILRYSNNIKEELDKIELYPEEKISLIFKIPMRSLETKEIKITYQKFNQIKEILLND